MKKPTKNSLPRDAAATRKFYLDLHELDKWPKAEVFLGYAAYSVLGLIYGGSIRWKKKTVIEQMIAHGHSPGSFEVCRVRVTPERMPR